MIEGEYRATMRDRAAERGWAFGAEPTVRISVAPLWAGLVFAFPVAVLFEQYADWVIYVPVAAMLATAALQLFRLPRQRAGAILVAIIAAGLVYGGLAWLAPQGSDADKIRQLGAVLAVFGAILAVCIVSPLGRHLSVVLAALGAVAAGVMLITPGEYAAGRYVFADNNPIWMGRAIGLLGLGGAALFLQKRLFLAGVLVLVSAVGILATGSRGPLIALALSVGLGMLLLRHRKSGLVVVLLWLGGLVGLLSTFFDFGVLRGLSLGDNLRFALFDHAVALASSHPEGIGVGRFDLAGIKYPHNVFLEVFAEWGLAAGVLFVCVVALGAVGIFQQDAAILKMLFVYELVNASVSGDVTSPRFLYALMIVGGFVLILRAAQKRQNRALDRTSRRVHPGRARPPNRVPVRVKRGV